MKKKYPAIITIAPNTETLVAQGIIKDDGSAKELEEKAVKEQSYNNRPYTLKDEDSKIPEGWVKIFE